MASQAMTSTFAQRPCSAREGGVHLDRDHARACERERLAQAAASGPDFEDELAALDAGVANDLGRELR